MDSSLWAASVWSHGRQKGAFGGPLGSESPIHVALMERRYTIAAMGARTERRLMPLVRMSNSYCAPDGARATR